MDNNVIQILIIAMAGGALYGLGVSILIFSLNTLTLHSLRSIIILGTYMVILYICAWFLPLGIGGLIANKLIFIDETLVIISLLEIPLFILVICLLFHFKFYKILWPPFAMGIMKIYALMLAIIAFVNIGLQYGFGKAFILERVSVQFFLSILILAILFFKNNIDSKPHVIVSDEKKLKPIPDELPKNKLIWFGIDSATWDVMSPMISEGKLPNLGLMMKTGSYGNLKTFIPTHSPVVWTTMATGKSPLKHGIRDFLFLKIKGMKELIEIMPVGPFLSKTIALVARFGIAKRRPVSSMDRKSLSIWNILSAMGYRVGVTSWFVTDPVEKINGFMVPEFFYIMGNPKRRISSSSSKNIHPLTIENDLKGIRSKLEERFNSKEGDDEVRERFRIDGTIAESEKNKFNILKVFYFHDQLRKEVTSYTIKQLDIDVLMVYFHGIDAVQHHFWDTMGNNKSRFKDVIPRFYEYIDEVIGELLKEISGSKTVFVTSDHGHGPMRYDKMVYNKILRRERLTGAHNYGPDGIFIASGEGIKKGVLLEDISVYDITPTILPVLGLPVGMDMDGRSLSEIFEDTIPSVKYIASYEGRFSIDSGNKDDLVENQEILERLRTLGYID